MIVDLDKQTRHMIPQVVDLYRSQLLEMKRYYEQTTLDYFLGRGPEFFEAVAQGNGFSGTQLLMSVNGHVNGVLEHARYALQIGKEKEDVIDVVWILAQETGKGIGSQMLGTLIDRFRSENTPDLLTLTVKKANTGAIRFYEKLGLNHLGQHPLDPNSVEYGMRFPQNLARAVA